MKKVYAVLFSLALTAIVCAAIYYYTLPRMIRHLENQGKEQQLDAVQLRDGAAEAITGVPADRDR